MADSTQVKWLHAGGAKAGLPSAVCRPPYVVVSRGDDAPRISCIGVARGEERGEEMR